MGNLALLKTTENTVAGNAKFSEKRPALGKSKFKLTSMVAKDGVWTTEEIEKRQKKLDKLAIKTWPLKG